MKKYSLHFGLNQVDPNYYGGWDGKLRGCINDAKAMSKICIENGFTAHVFTDGQCTYANFSAQVAYLASVAKRGDVVYITYSGHGGSLKDQSQQEADDYDETICLYDGQVRDNAVHALFGLFGKSVNVVWISDSCHAETNARMTKHPNLKIKARPADVVSQVFGGDESIMTKCNLVAIAGCKDHQYSYDGDVNGVFTGALVRTYNAGIRKSLRLIEKDLNAGMPMGQNPCVVYYSGAKSLLKTRKIWQ